MTVTRPAAAVGAVLTAAAVLLTVLVAASGPANADQTAATQAAPLRIRLHAAVLSLPLAREHTGGYQRELFDHWTDADGDGCNTREEVLIAESRVRPRVGDGCRVSGRWYSYYDGAWWDDKSDVDIDHLVALAEAWDSGAWRWSAGRRRAYANDLRDHRTLVAVTDNVNQSKGARDFAEWLPRYGTRCRYLGEYVAVKLRWRLTIDPAERHWLWHIARQCPDVVVTVTRV